MVRSPRFALLAALLALPAGTAVAQTPSPSFHVIGHIEAFSLDAGADPLRGGVMTVANLPIRLPANLLVVMPGRYLSVADLFRNPVAPASGASGLALADHPAVPFEADIIGNIVEGQYVAGVARVSQGELHTGAGFIESIDLPTGEIRIRAPGAAAGARVRLNDPAGVYGLANGAGQKAAIPLDARFAADEGNASIRAATGYPVCVPRSGADARCPDANRPPPGEAGFRYTCGPLAPPADPPAPALSGCDPHRPAPLRAGDYVTYTGILAPDPAGGFLIAASALVAELGIYTSPGADPAYVAIEEARLGTKGEEFAGIPQEETTRFRIVGFTTDPVRNVAVEIFDSGRGARGEGVVFTGAGGLKPEDTPLGRFRFTWPSKDNSRAVRRDVRARIVGAAAGQENGLASGQYEAPVSEYIYPEATAFGVKGFPVSVPFENFCFLGNGIQGGAGGGVFETSSGTVTVGALDPFPKSGHEESQLVGAGPGRACDGR